MRETTWGKVHYSATTKEVFFRFRKKVAQFIDVCVHLHAAACYLTYQANVYDHSR